jgi:hypothetical protein
VPRPVERRPAELPPAELPPAELPRVPRAELSALADRQALSARPRVIAREPPTHAAKRGVSAARASTSPPAAAIPEPPTRLATTPACAEPQCAHRPDALGSIAVRRCAVRAIWVPCVCMACRNVRLPSPERACSAGPGAARDLPRCSRAAEPPRIVSLPSTTRAAVASKRSDSTSPNSPASRLSRRAAEVFHRAAAAATLFSPRAVDRVRRIRQSRSIVWQVLVERRCLDVMLPRLV